MPNDIRQRPAFPSCSHGRRALDSDRRASHAAPCRATPGGGGVEQDAIADAEGAPTATLIARTRRPARSAASRTRSFSDAIAGKRSTNGDRASVSSSRALQRGARLGVPFDDGRLRPPMSRPMIVAVSTADRTRDTVADPLTSTASRMTTPTTTRAVRSTLRVEGVVENTMQTAPASVPSTVRGRRQRGAADDHGGDHVELVATPRSDGGAEPCLRRWRKPHEQPLAT